MNNDLLTAVLIVGGFFLFLFCVFAEGFIREWIAEERYKSGLRQSSKWVFAETDKRYHSVGE